LSKISSQKCFLDSLEISFGEKVLDNFFFEKLKLKIENEKINLAFSPFDHDVNVPIF
jgi:hypothetical protein